MADVSTWGEWWVRGSIWLALLTYPASAWRYASAAPRVRRALLWIWSCGALLFWIHVWGAFEVFYSWSHAVALEETARQVEELTGRPSSWGLYLNYLFGIVWTLDLIRSWRRDVMIQERWSYLLGIQSFFLFMIFNGTVVFESGATRVMGVVVCSAVLFALWRLRRGAGPGTSEHAVPREATR